jgi:hypothetical protein
LTVCVVVCSLIAAGVAIAARFGAFSGQITITDAKACKTSTAALTTAWGSRVLTGRTDAGVYCLTYEDADGAALRTENTFPTPDGQVIGAGVFDTVSKTWVVVGVVPPGYDKLSIGSQQIAIKTQAFVIDPKLAASSGTASSPGTLSGPAGTTTIDLSAFASP